MISFMPRDKLVPFIESISKKIEVVLPVHQDGAAVFSAWSGGGQVPAFDGENPLGSPVEFMMPQRDVLFRYVQYSGKYTFDEAEARTRMLMGVRPCDLKAITILDKLFMSEPCDHLYLNHRRSTVIAVFNCIHPGDGCSCSRLGSGPGCSEGYDLLFTDVGSGYLVETGSAAGVLISGDYADFFSEAGVEHIAEKDLRLKAAEASIRPGPSVQQIRDSIGTAKWEDIGRECLGCCGCSFVCPVCHCFNILDLGVPDGERVRCRDSCLLSGFSRMTSGANPRKSQAERMHNWYMDKFEYIPGRTGIVGCVGCGRCAKVCLSKFDRWTLEVV